jgi:hypothetical protein
VLKPFKLYLLFILVANSFCAQKTLQIFQSRFGSFKKYEFYCGDKISVRLKGELFFHQHIIANMNDSLLLVEDDSIVKLSQIKAVRFKKGRNAMKRFGLFFINGAVTILYVDAIANYMYGKVLSVDPRALYIAGAFGAGYILFQMITTKKVRINRRGTIKVFDPQYHKINAL